MQNSQAAPNMFDNMNHPSPKNLPLGKILNQLEHTNPEARAGLLRILEMQMREKRAKVEKEASNNRQFQDRIRDAAEAFKYDMDM